MGCSPVVLAGRGWLFGPSMRARLPSSRLGTGGEGSPSTGMLPRLSNASVFPARFGITLASAGRLRAPLPSLSACGALLRRVWGLPNPAPALQQPQEAVVTVPVPSCGLALSVDPPCPQCSTPAAAPGQARSFLITGKPAGNLHRTLPCSWSLKRPAGCPCWM